MKIDYTGYSNLISCLEYVRGRSFSDLPLDFKFLRSLYKPGDLIEISYTGKPVIEEPLAEGKNPKLEKEYALLGELFNGEYRVVVDKSQYVIRSQRKAKPEHDDDSVHSGDLIHYALYKLDVAPGEGIVYNTKTGRIERRVCRKRDDHEAKSELKPILRNFSRKYAIDTAIYADFHKRTRGSSSLTKGYALSTMTTLALGAFLGYGASISPAYLPLVENSLRTIDSVGGDVYALAKGGKWGRRLALLGMSFLPLAWGVDFIVRGMGGEPTDLWYVPVAMLFQCVDSLAQGIYQAKKNGRKDLLWATLGGLLAGGAAASVYRLIVNAMGAPPSPAFTGIDAAAFISVADVSTMRGIMRHSEKRQEKGLLAALCSDSQLSGYKAQLKTQGYYDFSVLGAGEFQKDAKLDSAPDSSQTQGYVPLVDDALVPGSA